MRLGAWWRLRRRRWGAKADELSGGGKRERGNGVMVWAAFFIFLGEQVFYTRMLDAPIVEDEREGRGFSHWNCTLIQTDESVFVTPLRSLL